MSWVAYAIETAFFVAMVLLGLLIGGLVIAVLAVGTVSGIAGLDRRRRVVAFIGVLAFAGFIASFWVLPEGNGAVAGRLAIHGALLLVCLAVVSALGHDMRHAGQWLALGAGALMQAGSLVLLSSTGSIDAVKGALWIAGVSTMLYGPQLVGALLRPHEPGTRGIWHPRRWSLDYAAWLPLLGLLLAFGMVWAFPGLDRRHPWLFFAILGSPLALLAIGGIVKHRLWHPSQWSAYRMGLLLVAASVFVALVLHAARVFEAAAVLIMLVGILAGVILTLYGHLRHPGQWLAAGAGIAAIVCAVAFPAEPRDQAIVLLAGLLTTLFAPRLVRWRLEARRKAPAELQKAHEELAELRLRPPPQPGLVVTTSSSTLLLIRAYMDETGAELAEAKAAVEKLLGKA